MKKKEINICVIFLTTVLQPFLRICSEPWLRKYIRDCYSDEVIGQLKFL